MKNSKNLSKKIQKTRLFSDAQRVQILVMLEDATDEDKRKLEAGIDAFDREYARAVAKHTAQIESLLGHLVKDMSPEEREENHEAIEEIKIGLALLQPAQVS